MSEPDAEPRSGAALPYEESPLLPPLSDAERWLYSLSRFGMKPGLHNIHALLDRFEHPERDLRFLHVAGSNGKGSVCMMLDALLRSSGRATGLFTSPHLLHVGERMRLSGRPCPEDRFAELLSSVEGAVSDLQATFFETMTLLSLLHFREAGVDWVLWETGLGGRLDCTNAVESEAAALCSLSLEHTRYLGASLEEIAREKLAIGRPGRPLFCCPLPGDLTALAREEAERIGFRLLELNSLLDWLPIRGGLRITRGGGALGSLAGDYELPGLSAVQAGNAALALAMLAKLGEERGERLLPDDPAAALASVSLPARFDLIRRDPPLVLDGAHNPEALAATLSAWLELGAGAAGEPLVVFGCMEDKERPELLDLLAAHPGRVLFTAAQQGRATPPAWFLEQPQAAGSSWGCAASLAEALCHEVLLGPLLVTGSFYLAAEAYHQLKVDPWNRSAI